MQSIILTFACIVKLIWNFWIRIYIVVSFLELLIKKLSQFRLVSV